MPSKLQVLVMDYSFEDSPVTLRGVDMNAGNIAAQFGLMDDVVNALAGVTLGTKVKDSRQAAVTEFARTRPVSQYAQRENKWLVRFLDTVNPNGNGSFEIPTPNLTLLDASGEYMDLGSVEGAALVAAIEAFHRSSLGNTVTVENIEYVGRNI